ncbi:MAG: enoyl-CoA hydratase/isomerase family protein [Pseudomonadota bacterium]
MAEEWIRQESRGGIVTLVLDGPPVNALDAGRLHHFADIIERIEARALVITSACKVLSAGMNLRTAAAADSAEQARIVDGLNRAFLALYAAPMPTICAAQGAAIAGGLFFVLASDWRIAGPTAQFGLAEVRVGVDFPAGPLGIAQDVLGPVEARRLMLPGEPIGAEAALVRGVVDEIAEDAQAAAAAKAEALAALPAAAYARVKSQLRAQSIAAIRAAIAEEDGRAWIDADARAAMERMLTR